MEEKTYRKPSKEELTKKLTVQAARFTKTASEKIEAAGGKVEVI